MKQNSDNVRRRVKVESDLTGTEYSIWVSNELKYCSYCGKDCTNAFQVDHVVPLKDNGKHEINNLAITCPTCNTSKGAKSLITFLAYKQGKKDG